MFRCHYMPVRSPLIRPRPDDCGPRAGYTLVEMLLVLAVILALASISWPAMERVYADYHLRRAAETMATAMAGARVRAIDAGTAYQFRFEPGGRRWCVLPYERDDLSGNSSDGASSASSAGVLSGEIPEPLYFLTTDPNAAVEQLNADALASLPEAALWTNVAWSSPIVYSADGSAVESHFDVADDKGNSYRISVRELTGAARVEQQATQDAQQLHAGGK